MRKGVQTDATCNIQQCWELLANKLRPFARGFSLVSFVLKSLLGIAIRNDEF